MKIKTKGKCSKCGKTYAAAQAGAHLLACALKSDTPSPSITEGYLIRISWSEQPGMYWSTGSLPIPALIMYTPLKSYFPSHGIPIWLLICKMIITSWDHG